MRWADNNGGLALDYGNYFRTPLCLAIKFGASDSVIAFLLTSANYKNHEYAEALFSTLVDTRTYHPLNRTLRCAYILLAAGFRLATVHWLRSDMQQVIQLLQVNISAQVHEKEL